MLIQCKSIFLLVGSAFCDSCQISTSHGIHVFPSQAESEKTADRETEKRREMVDRKKPCQSNQ